MSMELPLSVTRGPGRNGLERLAISSPRATAEVYLHGAHVTAWQPAGAAPVIWMSADSQFQADKPIRGGVPICFPWFAAHATDAAAPMHGFARLREWALSGAEDRDGEVHVTFGLTDDDTSHRSAWPHRFAASYRITIGDRLAMTLDVTNTGETPLTFEAALHSYFAVKDVRQVHVTGLAGTEYLDKVDGFARKRAGRDADRVCRRDRPNLSRYREHVHDPRSGVAPRHRDRQDGLPIDHRLEPLDRPGPGDAGFRRRRMAVDGVRGNRQRPRRGRAPRARLASSDGCGHRGSFRYGVGDTRGGSESRRKATR